MFKQRNGEKKKKEREKRERWKSMEVRNVDELSS